MKHPQKPDFSAIIKGAIETVAIIIICQILKLLAFLKK